MHDRHIGLNCLKHMSKPLSVLASLSTSSLFVISKLPQKNENTRLDKNRSTEVSARAQSLPSGRGGMQSCAPTSARADCGASWQLLLQQSCSQGQKIKHCYVKCSDHFNSSRQLSHEFACILLEYIQSHILATLATPARCAELLQWWTIPQHNYCILASSSGKVHQIPVQCNAPLNAPIRLN